MKNLRQLCATIVLTLLLAGSAFAGEINADGRQLPPPPPPPSNGTVGARQEVADKTPSMTDYAYDALTEALLLFCQDILVS